MNRKITISVTGCCLVNFIYPDIDFSSESMMQYPSLDRGDSGLHPGRLVFRDSLEQKSDKKLNEILKEIAGSKSVPFSNIGGPSVVSIIHTSQLLFEIDAQVKFYGIHG